MLRGSWLRAVKRVLASGAVSTLVTNVSLQFPFRLVCSLFGPGKPPACHDFACIMLESRSPSNLKSSCGKFLTGIPKVAKKNCQKSNKLLLKFLHIFIFNLQPRPQGAFPYLLIEEDLTGPKREQTNRKETGKRSLSAPLSLH